ncbi:MAG: glycosyltransferase [Sulfitobacter sp.]|nr:glycosyltransferase [Sulfitobacter sp.]
MRVAICVTHLLGTGHLARVLTLARALAAAGDEPLVLSGGLPAPHLSTEGVGLIQLPPVRSDGVDFSRLLDPQGDLAGADYMERRARLLRERMADFAPDVLLTELFPFGRRSLKEEYLNLLADQAERRPRPLICASIRDILAPPSKPRKATFAEETLRDHYDAVLVHAVEELTPLELSWPVTPALAGYLHYTGFVAPPPAGPHPARTGEGEVLVSAGGGDVGRHLFECASQAARLDPGRNWRLLVGGGDSAARVASLRASAPENLIVEAARSDFRQMLYHAAASVSFCGYNTALDILQAGTPAVFVPFDAGQEVEQGIRAKALSARDGITVVPSDRLDAETLLAAVTAVTDAPRRPAIEDGMDGAARSAGLLTTLLADRA